jgi:hypothetical protein
MISSFSSGLLCGSVKILRNSSATWENTLVTMGRIGSAGVCYIQETLGRSVLWTLAHTSVQNGWTL